MDFNFGVNSLVNGAIQAGIIIVIAIVLVIIARAFIPKIIQTRIPKIREESSEELASRSSTLSDVIVKVFAVLVWGIAIVMILSQLGVDIAPLIAAIGIVGLALGFAAQTIVRDYLNGFFILMEDWYRVGEVAVIQGTGGLVEKIKKGQL